MNNGANIAGKGNQKAGQQGIKFPFQLFGSDKDIVHTRNNCGLYTVFGFVIQVIQLEFIGESERAFFYHGLMAE